MIKPLVHFSKLHIQSLSNWVLIQNCDHFVLLSFFVTSFRNALWMRQMHPWKKKEHKSSTRTTTTTKTTAVKKLLTTSSMSESIMHIWLRLSNKLHSRFCQICMLSTIYIHHFFFVPHLYHYLYFFFSFVYTATTSQLIFSSMLQAISFFFLFYCSQ